MRDLCVRWIFPLLIAMAGVAMAQEEELYISRDLIPPNQFKAIEGPAVSADGVLYAVNFQRQGTIGSVSADGQVQLFLELANDSIGNGIRFDSHGAMLIADYTNHNVLRIDMATRTIGTLAHESEMNQPNDLAIGADDRVYASDPNWGANTGQLWRIDPDGKVALLESGMGTTNGVEVGSDERTLYVNESVQLNVWAYDLSAVGEVSGKRLLVHFDDFGLDGMRCDTLGNLYITRFGKGTVVKVSPTGELLREIELTGKQPTNIAFGGPDGRTAYVTVNDRHNIETFRVETPGRSWALIQQRLPSAVEPATWGRVKIQAP